MIPAICTLLGAIFSCTNYFRVIFTGGVGKNGSTIAVSPQCPVLVCNASFRLMRCTALPWCLMTTAQCFDQLDSLFLHSR